MYTNQRPLLHLLLTRTVLISKFLDNGLTFGSTDRKLDYGPWIPPLRIQKSPANCKPDWESCCFLHLLRTNSATLLPSILWQLPCISQIPITERSTTELCLICDAAKIKDHITCHCNRLSLFLVSFLRDWNCKWPKQITRTFLHTLPSSLTLCIMKILSPRGRTKSPD
jgi:hypothetical protein